MPEIVSISSAAPEAYGSSRNVSTEIPQIYSVAILDLASRYSGSIDVAAALLGDLSTIQTVELQTIIAGFILEEFNDRNESLIDIVEQNGADLWALLRYTDETIRNSVAAIDLDPSLLDLRGRAKLDSPATVDVGFLWQQLGTAHRHFTRLQDCER